MEKFRVKLIAYRTLICLLFLLQTKNLNFSNLHFMTKFCLTLIFSINCVDVMHDHIENREINKGS
jgi:hypothetical protein